MQQQNFTTPQVHKGKSWYIGFNYFPDGIPKAIQVRAGINRIADLKQREQVGEALKSSVNLALLAGWNPKEQTYEAFVAKHGVPTTKAEMTLTDALKFALNEKRNQLADKSITAYEGTINFVGQNWTPIKKVDRVTIKEILKPLTGYAYNRHKTILKSLFSELMEWSKVTSNPCKDIADVPVSKTHIHHHPTVEQERRIKDCLKAKHYQLYKFLAFVEMCGMREEEVIRLRIKDYNRSEQCFELAPENSKTRESRRIAIPNAMLWVLEDLYKYPSDYFIFGKLLETSAEPTYRDYVTRLWKRLIKDGLGINITIYAFKGLGGEKKIAAGISKSAVSKQFGHATTRTTDIYLEREEERRRKEIQLLTPEF